MDQLTLDSIAAEKAGMSYGKWKALQAKPIEAAIPKIDEDELVIAGEPQRRCLLCGKNITYSHGSRKYCSGDCYDEVQKVRQRGYKRSDRGPIM